MSTSRWSFEATREAPGDGRRAIRDFAAAAGATARALGAMAVCVTEAISNVVVHAYRHDEQPGRVEIEAELDGGSLWVRVRDHGHGHGLEPRLDSPGLGLGLPLISQISASSEIVSPEHGGTEVIMRFELREPEDGTR